MNNHRGTRTSDGNTTGRKLSESQWGVSLSGVSPARQPVKQRDFILRGAETYVRPLNICPNQSQETVTTPEGKRSRF